MKNFKYFILGLILFIIPLYTNALTNYNSSYTIEPFDWDSYLSNVNCGGENLKEVIDDFIENYDNTYFEAFIYADYSQDLTDGSYGSRFYIYLIPKNHNRNALYWYGDDSHNFGFNYQFTNTYNLNSSAVMYRLTTANCSANSLTITNTTTWNDLLNAMNTGYGNYDNVYNAISTIDRYNYSIWELPKWASGVKHINSLDFNNNDSFTIENVILPYYSSEPLYFNTNVSSSGYYLKNLIINGNTYTYGDEIPTYVNLPSPVPPEPEFTYIGYQDSLKSFYTNLVPSNINSYQLQVHFKVPQSLLGYYQEPQDYIDNTTFNYYCSGRVDYSDYYIYESFPCSLTSSYVLTDSTIDYTFNNVSYSTVLSNYDKIYITIKSNYLDSEVSTTLYNYSYTYNLGGFFNTDYKGSIYEDFTSLPLNFKMYFSSNNSITNSDLYIKKINFLNYGLHYIGFDNSNQQQNLVIGESIIGQATNSFLGIEPVEFIKSSVSNNINSGIMIYQQNSSIPLIKLDLFFNSGIVISLNSSNNDNFYYIDSTGSITNDNFVIPTGIYSNKYDISYYINEVNNFINGLSNDSLELGALTQDFYNNLPLFFQTFIFVVFILACVYFTYLLIRKW